MREIEELQRQLRLQTEEALRSWRPELSALQAAHEHTSGLLKRETSPRMLPADFEEQLRKAMATLRTAGAFMDARTLRLACYGAGTPISNGEEPLIADEQGFKRLLECVTDGVEDTRRFRRLFAGLLSAYFSIDRSARWFQRESAQASNTKLRRYLERTFDLCKGVEPSLDWVEALREYPELLSDNPGHRFVAAVLDNNASSFDDVTRRIGISATSWLTTEVFRAAVIEATSNPDQEFKGYLPPLLKALEEPRYIAVRDETLARLLTRYCSTPNPTVHAQLRDALVAAWKNPWLNRNEAAWGRVTPAARQTVASWLKLELIHQFFEVLSEEGRQDKSRFEFWRSYHDRMDDAYFALGSSAFDSKSEDLKKLRTALDGRLFELVGGQSDTHAIIMKFGELVIVEFSQKGNAAYTYSTRSFSLPEDTTRLSLGHLRQDRDNRLFHRNAGGMDWQERFRRALQPLERARPAEMQPVTMASEDVARVARLKGLTVEDNRARGGNLRIDGAVDPEFAEQLTRWGFRFKAERGWWRAA